MKGVVASVMHTGTFFTFEAIKRLTGDVVLPWRHTFLSSVSDCDWLHVHVNPEPWSELRYIRPMLLEAFVERAQYPTVIPLRDPVLALITRHLRREQDKVPPNAGLLDIVDGFSRLAEWYGQELGHVFWLPVDRYEAPKDRLDLLGELLAFLHGDLSGYLDHNPGGQYQLARDWPVHNGTRVLSTLKQRYLKGDVAAVEAVLPAEMEALRDRPGVVAMFTDLGYSLPWLT